MLNSVVNLGVSVGVGMMLVYDASVLSSLYVLLLLFFFFFRVRVCFLCGVFPYGCGFPCVWCVCVFCVGGVIVCAM